MLFVEFIFLYLRPKISLIFLQISRFEFPVHPFIDKQ